MRFDVITIFPGFFASILQHGVLKRAIASGEASIHLHDLRDFTDDAHRTVDDRPFGGGPGMVLKPEPVFRAVDHLKSEAGFNPQARLRVILLTPQGRVFNQQLADDLSREPRLVLICGRYEGVDERVAAHLATDEISIGDFVMSGGELPAAVVMETIVRLLPGVLGNEESTVWESFAVSGKESQPPGLLGFPQYTRPADFRGLKAPDILLSGNHEAIRAWRSRQALLKTDRLRPDLTGSRAEAAVSNKDEKGLAPCHS